MDYRKVLHNSIWVIGCVPFQLDSFVVAESSVIRTNFFAEKHAYRQSVKRYIIQNKRTILLITFQLF
jgi:hypothetical protein